MSLTKKGTDNKFTKLEEAVNQDNDNFLNEQKAQQLEVKEEVDKNLTILGNQVKTLRNHANEIDVTLERQGNTINKMETETNRAQGGVKSAVSKVNKLLDSTSDSTQWGIIIVLILVLVGMIVLIYHYKPF